MKQMLLGLAACTLSLTVGAQQYQCGTDQMRAERIAKDPTYLQREAEYEADVQRLIRNSTEMRGRDVIITIPIVFHIIHLGGSENITNEQILNEVELLNQDYSATNPDIDEVREGMVPFIGNAEFRFELPTRDPEGNCTNGIDRIRTPETLVGDDGSKMNPWPRDKYLNVWVVKQMRDGVAGYAYYPSTFTDPISRMADGIIILNNYIGEIGTSNSNSSTALSHEVGHYLNLSHVWGSNNGGEEAGGNAPYGHMQSTCGDDNVDDTPYTRGWNRCPTGATSDPLAWKNWRDCELQSMSDVRYTFEDVTVNTGTQDPGPVPNALDSLTDAIRCVASPFTSHGVSENSSVDDKFAFTQWDEGATDGDNDFANLTGFFDPNTAKYYEFTIDPRVEDAATVTGLTFAMSRNLTGPRTFAVRSSANNFASNLPISGSGDALITVQTGVNLNQAFYDTDTNLTVPLMRVGPFTGAGASTYFNFLDGLTFRIYAWNAEDQDGSFEVDDVQLLGNFGVIENVQNFMEYSYCSNMFTMGQTARMRAALNSSVGQRDILWSESNLQATGIAEGFRSQCPPKADFYARTALLGQGTQEVPFTPLACTGTNLQFVDNSVGGLPTGWSWTFQDGDPATSTERNPVVSFNSGGYKTVSLTASNDNGSDTRTTEYDILIGGQPNDFTGAFSEGFENGSSVFPWLSINYAENNTAFRRTTSAAYAGNACVMLNSGERNFLDYIDPNNERDYDDLISPTFNLDPLISGTFSFRYAYSTGTSDLAEITERLEVATSTDCGNSWQQLPSGTITTGELVNNGNNPQLPPPAWASKSFNLSPSRLAPDVRFRFRYLSSAFSGNLYIDDINIAGAVGIEDLSPTFFMSLYPNPTSDRFSLAVYGMDKFTTDITVTDLRGAIVYRTVRRAAGDRGMEFSGSELGLSDGMYMIRATNEAGNSTQKLIIGH